MPSHQDLCQLEGVLQFPKYLDQLLQCERVRDLQRKRIYCPDPQLHQSGVHLRLRFFEHTMMISRSDMLFINLISLSLFQLHHFLSALLFRVGVRKIL